MIINNVNNCISFKSCLQLNQVSGGKRGKRGEGRRRRKEKEKKEGEERKRKEKGGERNTQSSPCASVIKHYSHYPTASAPKKFHFDYYLL